MHALIGERQLSASGAPIQNVRYRVAELTITPRQPALWLGVRRCRPRAPTVAQAWRLAADVHETAIMAPPLNAAVVADWISTGTFERLISAVRTEAKSRQKIVADCLPAADFTSQEEGYHLWMPLSGDVDVPHAISNLRLHGLSSIGSDSFAVAQINPLRALRISIGGLISRERLERGLRLLGALTTPDVTRKISLI